MGAESGNEGLNTLFETSPDRAVHTSATAEIAFLCGLLTACTAPFSEVQGLAVVTGVATIVFVVAGIATTSRPHVAGRALVPAGLLLALAGLVLVGLGYAGFDVTFGDAFVPTMASWLDSLHAWLRLP